jgi:RNA methyltransferase, TrmH family
VRDPGNIGTLLRAAAGAGADGVILTPGCADPWGLKALRAGMGAQLRMPMLTSASWPDIEALLRRDLGCEVCVADGDDAGSLHAGFERKPAVSYTKYDWRGPRALVVGSEADGASAEAHALASARVSIPMANGMESLNAAVAGAVVLFEASRQRTTDL